MYITSPDPQTKTIEEYDFDFTSGMMPTVYIDRDAGDTIDLDTYPHAIVINLSEKPSIMDPENFSAAEQITIFTGHLIAIRKRVKQIAELTQEQKDLMRMTVQEISKLSKTIQ